MSEVQHPQLGVGRLKGSELSAVCQRIYAAESQSGLLEGRDYRINLQQGKRPNQPFRDAAPAPLIGYVNENVLSRSTYAAFRSLLDNYTRDTGVAEVITPEKEREVSNFLDGVLQSAPMRVAHDFLAGKDLVARDHSRFKSQLYQMWFRLYTRDTRDDTCGFEHVFVGESKGGEITGLHNWLQFFNLERSGNIDYRGYIFPHRKAGAGDVEIVTPQDQIISVQFNLDGEVKDVSSIWLGTSPEFELALYTVCFIAGGQNNIIEFSTPTGIYEVEIRCYHIRSKYGDKVGSAFPVLLSKQPGAYHPAQLPAWQQQQSQQPPAWQSQPSPAWQTPPQQAAYNQQAPQQNAPQNQDSGSLLGALLRALFGCFSQK